jgi:uroporphyrinogen III methyltransferase / synthase
MTLQASKRRRVLITRSRGGNEELARRLDEMGFEPVSIETMTFSPPEDWSAVDDSLKRLRQFDWLIFTSAKGAEFFARRASELSIRVPWRGKPAVAAVGEKTRAALRKAGVKVRFVPSEYLGETLAVELPSDRGEEALLLRAHISSPVMTRVLKNRGFRVEERAIYRTLLSKEAAEPNLRDIDAIIFASPSAVEAFSSMVDLRALERARTLLALCIGPVTAQAARARGFARIATPRAHTFDGVLEELGRVTRDA